MKRYRWAIPLVAGAMVALFTVYVHAQYETAAQPNGLNGLALAPADISLSQATRGVVFKTAAINSDGTVANCFRCVKVSTIHLGTGQYQIAFDENVQATNGWSRWVQPDTLGIGTEKPASFGEKSPISFLAPSDGFGILGTPRIKDHSFGYTGL